MNDKREDHPLWGAFLKAMEEDHCICRECMEAPVTLDRWTWFLAGAVAAEATRPHDRPVNVVVRIEATAEGAKLDRILEVMESLPTQEGSKPGMTTTEGPPRYYLPICVKRPLGFCGGPSGYQEIPENEIERGCVVVKPDNET